MWSRWLPRLAVVANVATFIAIWEYVTRVQGLISPVFLPPPSRVLEGLLSLHASGELAAGLSYSAVNYVLGYVLAAVVGISLGAVFGGSRRLGQAFRPIVWSLYAAPWVAFRPIATIWFGFGRGPVIFIVFLAAVFPVLLNTAAGAGDMRLSQIRAGRVFGANRVNLYTKIIIPSVFPYILVGLEQAVVLGVIGLLVGEMLGSPAGIGMLITLTSATFRLGETFALIFLSVAFAIGLRSILRAAAAPYTRWASLSSGRA